ncbi:hypothetical protein [Corynebacterium phocae]|uniref:hypothetical protein n=1 Tax=Corynebacterium phocae TaxID=161895 RepID=UPI001B801FBC|nr:hypothetical protein [Corynebacterium phocae]
MNDEQWLSTRTYSWQVDSFPSAPTRVVVAPPHIATTLGLSQVVDKDGTAGGEPAPGCPAEPLSAPEVIAVAGYPTGRHHTLVKAAEARLAVQTGAVEVWVCVDGGNTDLNAHLAELITVRDACPYPARLGLIVPQALGHILPPALGSNCPVSARALADCAAKAGFERVIVPAASGEPAGAAWPVEAVALAGEGADVIAQLEGGAAYVALRA